MLHFAIGTKAQFIKMVPLMHVLDVMGKPFHVLNLSQHGRMTQSILDDFGVNPSMTLFNKDPQVIDSYRGVVHWLAGSIHYLISKKKTLRELFNDQPGIVLIHGDTLSTLIGLVLAKRAGLPVGIVEAGLTSHHFFNPFPEELIRSFCQRRANILFPPGDSEKSRLQITCSERNIINTGYNTGLDALKLIMTRHGQQVENKGYLMVTLHRLETISRRNSLIHALQYIGEIAGYFPETRFILHPPTLRFIKKFGLEDRLHQIKNIRVESLKRYSAFIGDLAGASAVVADGGSIQEESYYLGKPCLILRKHTERPHGLDSNARLYSGDVFSDYQFLATRRYKTMMGTNELEASKEIINNCSPWLNKIGLF